MDLEIVVFWALLVYHNIFLDHVDDPFCIFFVVSYLYFVHDAHRLAAGNSGQNLSLPSSSWTPGMSGRQSLPF